MAPQNGPNYPDGLPSERFVESASSSGPIRVDEERDQVDAALRQNVGVAADVHGGRRSCWTAAELAAAATSSTSAAAYSRL